MEALQKKIEKLLPFLNEKQRRLYLATEAQALGRGGKTLIATIASISRPTLNKAEKELESSGGTQTGRIRKEGGGRKKITQTDPTILKDLEALVEPVSRGDPESALRWTIKSTRTLAEALAEEGHKIGKSTVAKLLSQLGYSLQANQKTREGRQHPDRNKQFEYINRKAELFMSSGDPVISVDTKKKELIGNYKNKGPEYRPKGQPRQVEGHDFGTRRAVPYGVYDIDKNKGFVNVGTSCDTGQFAVASIREWWAAIGNRQYPRADKLLINADGGGSNGYRLKQWKYELQKLADETNLKISVCHFPPGTSKWNKIEHRLFSQISLNWRGIPLVDYQTVVRLIGNVKTQSGLSVKATLDENEYEKGRKISKKQMEQINLTKSEFHGEWNYTIAPIT